MRTITTTSPELALLYLRRKNIAKARRALSRQRSWLRNATQEEINKFFERKFHELNEADFVRESRVKPQKLTKRQLLTAELEEKIAKYQPPKKPEKNPAAVKLGSLGGRAAAEKARKGLMGNKRAVGHIPWNKGKNKRTDTRLQHMSDLLKLKIEQPDIEWPMV
jgi:uncharacterized protein YdaT